MFPLLVSHGNMIPASQPQIPYCRISCMCVSFLGDWFSRARLHEMLLQKSKLFTVIPGPTLLPMVPM